MTEIYSSKPQICFNKNEKTVSVISTDKSGRKTTVTIFADSGDQKKPENNSIFDSGDKITVTVVDAQGKPVSMTTPPQVDSMVISKLLSNIENQTIDQASKIIEILPSGNMFDPTNINGVRRQDITFGALLDSANNASQSAKTSSSDSTDSSTTPTAPNGTELSKLRERYGALQNKKMILQNLANLVGQSQMTMDTLNSPFIGMVPQIFANNGFDIAALVAMQNHPAVIAFQESAGISIQDAIDYINNEAAAIKSELQSQGKTEEDLTNIGVVGTRKSDTTHPTTTVPVISEDETPSVTPKSDDKADSTQAIKTKQDLSTALSTLGLNDTAEKYIYDVIENGSQEDREAIMEILGEALKYSVSENMIPNYEKINELKDKLLKLVYEKSPLISKARGQETLNIQAIVDKYDSNDFEGFFGNINEDNVLEVVNALNASASKNGDNIFQDTNEKDMQRIVYLLSQRAVALGMDINTNKAYKDFMDHISKYKNPKTDMTEEGYAALCQSFTTLIQEMNKLDKDSKYKTFFNNNK